MRLGLCCVWGGVGLLMAALPCCAQTATPANAGSAGSMSDQELTHMVANSLGKGANVPARGLNASVTSSSQFDSITGAANVLTPAVGWRFNQYVSADVSTPVFMYLRSSRTVAATSPAVPPRTDTTVRHALPGDTTMAAHVSSKTFAMGRLGDFRDAVTGSLVAPTGSVEDGVGAGKATYNVTNHLQSESFLAPYVDLGIGSTSRLQSQRLQRAQTSRGELANFGVGVSMALPHASTVYLEAYEQLPIGKQTVFQVTPRYGRPSAAQGSNGLAEDNGINLSADIPVAQHLMWSAFYSRGLRLHEDTAGFSFTVLLRNPRQSNGNR